MVHPGQVEAPDSWVASVSPGEGIYTHMKALHVRTRSSQPHSPVYVDQWDWEKVMPGERRIWPICRRRCGIWAAIKATERGSVPSTT